MSDGSWSHSRAAGWTTLEHCFARATRVFATTTRFRSRRLDLLVELAEAAGAYGARLLGGGFGGAILALVPKSTGHQIGRTIAGGYRTQTGLDASTLTVFPSAGARLEAT